MSLPKIIARSTANIGATRYKVGLRIGRHELIADEPPVLGGQDSGPSPFGLLLASLGACTVMTLKMYAERKDWPLESVEIDLQLDLSGDVKTIERTITLHAALNEQQLSRLAEIAERTPVTLAIMKGLPISTAFRTKDGSHD